MAAELKNIDTGNPVCYKLHAFQDMGFEAKKQRYRTQKHPDSFVRLTAYENISLPL